MAGVGGVSCIRQANKKTTLAFNHSSSLKAINEKPQAKRQFGCDVTLNTETETNSCRFSFFNAASVQTLTHSDLHLISSQNVA